MIEVYKMFNGLVLDDINVQDYFDLDRNDRTRRHGLKLKKKSFKLDLRKNFCRVVDWWNHLPADVVHSPTLSTFKNKLDKHNGPQ